MKVTCPSCMAALVFDAKSGKMECKYCGCQFDLQDVADHLGYSYFYISKRIRQGMGVSFTTLLAQFRIARAKMLLDSGKCTVSQAALSSGFGSIRTFNRVFHELTGLTPSQYLAGPSRTEVFQLTE